MTRRHTLAALTLLSLLGGVPAASASLQADQLLLIVNKNQPEGLKAAQQYARLRNVPDGRIVELAVSAGEELTFDQYERAVVPPVRRFIDEHNLRDQIKCLVPFYGVPLRVARRELTPEENRELHDLQAQVSKIRLQIDPIVAEFEALATKMDPSFKPPALVGGVGVAAERAERAGNVIQQRIPSLTDPAARDQALKSMLAVAEKLGGPAAVTRYLAKQDMAKPDLPAAERNKWTDLLAFIDRTRKQIRELQDARYDAGARARLRDVVEKNFGLLEYAGVVQGQLEYLRAGDSSSSVDNELALLWWDLYPRAAWQPNPLNHRVPSAARADVPPVVMVSRVDAPTAAGLQAMMAGTLQAEQRGLTGRVAIDSRGLDPRKAGKPDPMGMFDQHLRDLAVLTKAKSSLPVTWDDTGELMPANTATDVALYCGWYSVQQYVASCAFRPGAVAYHVASFELTTLHTAGTSQWVANLLKAGAVASVGPVAEPYLHAFPLPDEFFPLLMTGKLTLAEVYWKTNPLVSWQMTLIGDPLYNPFGKAPAMKVEDLPQGLRGALVEPSTLPLAFPPLSSPPASPPAPPAPTP